MIDNRAAQVLYALVAEYITTGRPIGSELLTQTMGLQISPATMRNILRDLEEEGFIEQPHTSAGRIPTDKGYRQYVNSLVAKDMNQRQKAKIAHELNALNETYGRPSRATAKLLSQLTQCLTISGWMESRDVQEAGLPEVMQQTYEGSAEALEEIASLLQHIDRYLRELSTTADVQAATSVYIGHENPLFEAVYTTSMVRVVQLPDGETVVLLMIGPKRMPYQRNLALLNSFASILKDQVI